MKSAKTSARAEEKEAIEHKEHLKISTSLSLFEGIQQNFKKIKILNFQEEI